MVFCCQRIIFRGNNLSDGEANIRKQRREVVALTCRVMPLGILVKTLGPMMIEMPPTGSIPPLGFLSFCGAHT
jgi:hypothetical protein